MLVIDVVSLSKPEANGLKERIYPMLKWITVWSQDAEDVSFDTDHRGFSRGCIPLPFYASIKVSALSAFSMIGGGFTMFCRKMCRLMK